MTKANVSAVLSSYSNYCNFMKGEKSISRLQKIAKEGEIKKNEFYEKIKLSFNLLKENFLMLITAQSLERFTPHYYKAKELINKINVLKKTLILGNRILVKSKNMVSYKYTYEDVEIATKDIDKKIKQYISDRDKTKKVINLFDTGVCRGMSEWFTYLYFKTMDCFKDRSKEFHIKAVAENFKYGSPVEGALLQMFPHSNSRIDPPIFFQGLYAQRFANPLKKREETINTLKKLPLGIYNLVTLGNGKDKGHACILIKLSSDLLYYWDPNYGLIKIMGDNIESTFLDLYKKCVLDLYRENIDSTGFSLTKMEPTHKKYFPKITEAYKGIYIFDARKSFFIKTLAYFSISNIIWTFF